MRECLGRLVRANDDEEAAYWIGMLMADGGISNGNVHLGLSEEKAEHLEAFARFIGAENVTYNPGGQIIKWKSGHFSVARPSWHVSKHSKKVAEVLASYGVVERKSLVACVRGLAYNRHFWRGVVDGDGWICTVASKRRNGRVEIRWATGICSGSEMFVKQFAEYVRSVCPDWRGKEVRPNSWGVYLVGRNAARLVRVLYENCAVALPRKMKLAQFIMTGKQPLRGMTSALPDYVRPQLPSY